jgi:hypothetical protein
MKTHVSQRQTTAPSRRRKVPVRGLSLNPSFRSFVPLQLHPALLGSLESPSRIACQLARISPQARANLFCCVAQSRVYHIPVLLTAITEVLIKGVGEAYERRFSPAEKGQWQYQRRLDLGSNHSGPAWRLGTRAGSKEHGDRGFEVRPDQVRASQVKAQYKHDGAGSKGSMEMGMALALALTCGVTAAAAVPPRLRCCTSRQQQRGGDPEIKA